LDDRSDSNKIVKFLIVILLFFQTNQHFVSIISFVFYNRLKLFKKIYIIFSTNQINIFELKYEHKNKFNIKPFNVPTLLQSPTTELYTCHSLTKDLPSIVEKPFQKLFSFLWKWRENNCFSKFKLQGNKFWKNFPYMKKQKIKNSMTPTQLTNHERMFFIRMKN